MNNDDKLEQLPFVIFPERRLYEDFPWQIWAIGLLVILKSVLWFMTAPLLPENILHVLFYKYLIFAFPLLIFGIGVWNLRKWAVRGLLYISLLELLFFIFYPESLKSFSVGSASLLELIFSTFLFLVNGPISDVFILINIPLLFRHSGKYLKPVQ